MSRPADLPDFNSPPIDEVVVGVQFESIEDFAGAHVGLFWNSIREEFPAVENQPWMNTPIESFDEDVPPQPQPIVLTGATQSRTWLTSADETYLIQVQDNCFFLNWRRRNEADYPHFDEVLLRFENFWSAFRSILNSSGLSDPVLKQVEISYFNWIVGMEPHEFFRPSDGMRLGIAGVSDYPDNQAVNGRYTVTDSDSSPVGRLHVACNSAYRPEPSGLARGTQVGFTFRSPTSASDEDGIVRARALLARDIIVKSFTGLTTVDAHEEWGRFQ